VAALQALAEDPSSRPDLPRSGHCLSQLPPWHEDDAIMFGGYVEAAGKQRYATNDVWTFNLGQGAWKRVKVSGSRLPRVGGGPPLHRHTHAVPSNGCTMNAASHGRIRRLHVLAL
jgi:hypothetical protein